MAIQIGLVLAILIGMASLGTEVALILFKHRQMQSAADAAALAAATALSKGYPADFRLEAFAVSSRIGFTNGQANTTINVNSPPLSGARAGDASAVEVIVAQPQNVTLMALFRQGAFDVRARSVAIVGSVGQYCIFALDPAASGALTVRNNAVVTNPKCGAAVNSSSSTALILRNNAAINGPVNVHGGISLANNAHLYGSPVASYAPALADPYADLTIPSPPACTSQSGSGGNNATVNLNPGHFCSGFDFANNVTVNLAPGVYYVDTKLVFGNNAVVNGTGGVTLVVNTNYAMTISNNTRLNITAPTSGTFAGIAFTSHRNATSTLTQTFDNNTRLNIQGVVYFPNQIINFYNNGTTGTAMCTQVIGRKINVQNNVELDNKCQGAGVKPIGASASRLVE